MLDKTTVVLIVIDVQGKLAQVMFEKEDLFKNLRRLIRGLQLLEIPILWMEQTPDKLGPTVPEIRVLFPDREAFHKQVFSCARQPRLMKHLVELNRPQVLLAGIETHVCVYQTAVDLLAKQYQVEVVADAVSSRTRFNRDLGLEKIVAAGGSKTSVETVLFELVKGTGHPHFKEIVNLVK